MQKYRFAQIVYFKQDILRLKIIIYSFLKIGN